MGTSMSEPIRAITQGEHVGCYNVFRGSQLGVLDTPWLDMTDEERQWVRDHS